MRLLVGVTILVALVFAGGSSAQANPTLFATVGPGFSIRVADGAGNRVTRIPPGTYTVVVKDQATEHNFHLSGPGVEQTTDVDATGTFTWTVTFQAGTYHYQCDPHFNIMKGDIAVEAGAPLPAPAPTTTTTTSTPPAPSPKQPVVLIGRVGPGAKISLTKSGTRVRVLPAGLVIISVTDASAKDNFHLTGPGVNKLTPRVRKAQLRWRVTLKRGLYRYRSDATPSLKGSFTVR